MNTFNETFGFIFALCAGVMILAVFFTTLGYLKRGVRGPGVLKMKGFVREGKRINVHLASGRTLDNFQFVGFTEQNSVKGAIPYQLASMAVFESKTGSRVMVRADSIRMIEEIEDAT